MLNKTDHISKDEAREVYNCPIEATLDVISGKWKLIILWYINEKTRRFSELDELIPNITVKVLSRQLKEMERDGLIERTSYPEIPPRVEYSITEYGKTLNPIIDMMCEWGTRHCEINEGYAEWKRC